MLILNWYRAKRAEYKIKAIAYGFIAGVIDNKKEIIEVGRKAFEAFKDATPDEIKAMLVEKIAELAHEQAVKERNEDN